MFVRFLMVLVCVGAMFHALPARAAFLGEVNGMLLVEESGAIRLNGKVIELWGIDTLAGDQLCWKGHQSWNCGEQAWVSLLHFVDNQTAVCNVKAMRLNGSLVAQCFVGIDGKQNDVASFLVSAGWAMDRDEESDGTYTETEEQARSARRGIWTSRFQTQENWKAGVKQFVEYDATPAPAMKTNPEADIIVGPAEYVHDDPPVVTDEDRQAPTLPSDLK